MEIGEKILELRKKEKLSQEQSSPQKVPDGSQDERSG